MVIERKIQTQEERLESMVDLGIRDANNQPGAPAMTLVLGFHRDLIQEVFTRRQREFCDDLSVQADVFKSFLEDDLIRRNESGFGIKTRLFEDKRTNERGFYIFLVAKGEGC